MADKEKAPKEVKDALRTQGELVAKMLRERDRLQGAGLEKAVAKYKAKLENKRKEIAANLAGEVKKLAELEAKAR